MKSIAAIGAIGLGRLIQRFGVATAFLALCVLSGCVTWEKPGGTQATFDADKAQCIVSASQQAPPAPVTTSTGAGYSTPVQTNCYRIGNAMNCTSTGGNYIAPVTTTYDANVVTRGYAFDSCMYSKGYTKHGR